MRVLFLLKSHPGVGGVEEWTCDLCRGLRNYGIDAVVGLTRSNRFHRPEVFRQYCGDVVTIEIDGTSGAEAGRRLAVSRALKRLSPEIVIPLGLADALVESAKSLAKRRRLKIVYTIHAHEAGVIGDLNKLGRACQRVVSVDKLSAKVIESIGCVSKKRIEVISHGVRQATKPRLNRKDRIRIAYVGRLDNRQKQSRMLPLICEQLAARRIPFELLIAGGGPEKNGVCAALSDHIEKGKVRFVGWRPKSQLYEEIYPNLDVLLVCSESETGPLSTWEAMMHGVVPVTSRYLGLCAEGFIRHEENALVYPVGDDAAAAKNIERLTSDDGLFKSLSAAARSCAEQSRSVEGMVSNWATLLRAVNGEDAVRFRYPGEQGGGSGRLDRMGVPPAIAELIRRLAGRSFKHNSPGEEWPRNLPCDKTIAELYERRLRELDC